MSSRRVMDSFCSRGESGFSQIDAVEITLTSSTVRNRGLFGDPFASRTEMQVGDDDSRCAFLQPMEQ